MSNTHLHSAPCVAVGHASMFPRSHSCEWNVCNHILRAAAAIHTQYGGYVALHLRINPHLMPQPTHYTHTHSLSISVLSVPSVSCSSVLDLLENHRRLHVRHARTHTRTTHPHVHLCTPLFSVRARSFRLPFDQLLTPSIDRIPMLQDEEEYMTAGRAALTDAQNSRGQCTAHC